MQLSGQLAGDAEAVDLLKQVVAIKVDLTVRDASNPARAVAAKYGVHGIPDFRIIDRDGKEILQTSRLDEIKKGIKRALGK